MSDKYVHLVQRHMQAGIRTGDEQMVKCLFHDDSNASMQFNVDSGLYLCFACHAKGNIKSLERHLGVRISEGEVDVVDIIARLDALRDQDTTPREAVLPESYLNQYKFPTDYWTERDFTQATIDSFDLGYDIMNDAVTIPLRNVNGGLLGVIRRYNGKNVRHNDRYRYPKGFKRASNLFASWLINQDDESDTVVLVEGSTDAMAVWQAGHAAGAIYGSSLSGAQHRLLRRLGVVRVILAFDNDTAGEKARNGALGYRSTVVRGQERWVYDRASDLRHSFIVEEVSYPRGVKDPGGMNDTQIRRMLRKSTHVD